MQYSSAGIWSDAPSKVESYDSALLGTLLNEDSIIFLKTR